MKELDNWQTMSKRKRRIYIKSFTELYGVVHGKEAVQTESISTNREKRARDIHEVALEGVPKSL